MSPERVISQKTFGRKDQNESLSLNMVVCYVIHSRFPEKVISQKTFGRRDQNESLSLKLVVCYVIHFSRLVLYQLTQVLAFLYLFMLHISIQKSKSKESCMLLNSVGICIVTKFHELQCQWFELRYSPPPKKNDISSFLFQFFLAEMENPNMFTPRSLQNWV